jgi:hypothetical protein
LQPGQAHEREGGGIDGSARLADNQLRGWSVGMGSTDA